ncbi:hypothetical protein GEMRC1_007661 [Eukaryota sp. GEM-RC1]
MPQKITEGLWKRQFHAVVKAKATLSLRDKKYIANSFFLPLFNIALVIALVQVGIPELNKLLNDRTEPPVRHLGPDTTGFPYPNQANPFVSNGIEVSDFIDNMPIFSEQSYPQFFPLDSPLDVDHYLFNHSSFEDPGFSSYALLFNDLTPTTLNLTLQFSPYPNLVPSAVHSTIHSFLMTNHLSIPVVFSRQDIPLPDFAFDIAGILMFATVIFIVMSFINSIPLFAQQIVKDTEQGTRQLMFCHGLFRSCYWLGSATIDFALYGAITVVVWLALYFGRVNFITDVPFIASFLPMIASAFIVVGYGYVLSFPFKKLKLV